MTSRSYTFTHAIARVPGTTIVDGLRAVDTGAPNLSWFRQHHEDYVDALRSTGAVVEVLQPLEEFPDSVFVEDVALCLPEGAVVMRPGAPSRLGEARAMAPHLAKHYDEIRTIEEPGFIEGGDILSTEREILVGQSARTNREGNPGRAVGPHQPRRNRRTEENRCRVGVYGPGSLNAGRRPALQVRLFASRRGDDPGHATPLRIRLFRGLPCDPYGRG